MPKGWFYSKKEKGWMRMAKIETDWKWRFWKKLPIFSKYTNGDVAPLTFYTVHNTKEALIRPTTVLVFFSPNFYAFALFFCVLASTSLNMFGKKIKKVPTHFVLMLILLTLTRFHPLPPKMVYIPPPLSLQLWLVIKTWDRRTQFSDGFPWRVKQEPKRTDALADYVLEQALINWKKGTKSKHYNRFPWWLIFLSGLIQDVYH